jgi:hypothetical protein
MGCWRLHIYTCGAVQDPVPLGVSVSRTEFVSVLDTMWEKPPGNIGMLVCGTLPGRGEIPKDGPPVSGGRGARP